MFNGRRKNPERKKGRGDGQDCTFLEFIEEFRKKQRSCGIQLSTADQRSCVKGEGSRAILHQDVSKSISRKMAECEESMGSAGKKKKS